jgi:signal transduction histidine kinase
MEPEKILIVDDEEVIRDACRQTLANEGYQTFLAVDGTDGLVKIRSEKPALVVLDIKMPGLDGMHVLQEIRNLDPEIVPVVITGYANLDTAIDAFKRGAYDFLPKPFSPEELRIIVKRGLERRRLRLESLTLQTEKQHMQKVFVAMVSHQLRSPLVTVQQGLEALVGGFVGGLSDQQTAMLVKLKDQVRKLLVLIKDWLNLSRIESGRLAESFGPVPLAQIVTEVENDFRQPVEAKRIVLRASVPGPAVVRGDRQALRQMLGNVVDNAVKFTPSGGTVTVTIEESPSGWALKVTDTGPGIESRELPLIFDEFYRANGGKERDETGTGLGLPIARKIAEAHSGTIEVESAPGKGSTFTMSLPRP